MADAAETKIVTISGLAAESMKQKKPRQTRKSKGGDLSPQVIHVDAHRGGLPLDTRVPLTVTQTSLVPPPVPPPVASPMPLSVTQDGGKIRVELKKKPQTKKVQLHPKKAEAQKAPLKKMQTKKNRKVLLGISSLHKRMTRAKKVHTAIKAMSLEKLKALLLSKKLIKPTSKAPESVLRQIASDAGIVEQNAL